MSNGPSSSASSSSSHGKEMGKLYFELDPMGPYRGLLENLPFAFYTCNKQGYLTYYNEAAAILWGRQPGLGKDRWTGAWKIYYPDGITQMPFEKCPMAITLQEERKVAGEQLIIERPDGVRRTTLSHPQLVYDEKGQLTGGANMLLDITVIKDAEIQTGRLAAIVQSSEDAIISKTLDGIVISWNPAAEKLFGYTAEEMIGQPITVIIPEDRLLEETRILERLRKGERVEHFETKRISKKGKLVDLSLTISPIRDERGNIIGVSKIARNINEAIELNEALQASEERLRMATDSMHMGTWDFQPLTKKIIWSDECRRIYGFTKERELESWMVIEHNHPDDKEYIANAVAAALDPNGNGDFRIEHRIIRDDNKQLRWVRVQGKVFFENNKPERFIGTMLDITEEKQSVELIRESEERLRMAIQSTKLGTWEFNPLAGTLNWSEECRIIYDVPAGVEINYNFFQEHIYPGDKEYAESAIQKAMDPSGSGDYNIQYRILRYSDKQPRWISAHGKVFFENGQVTRFIGTVLDITTEKEAENELKESVELFQTMADNVPAMIWMSGTDKFNDYFNKTWLEFTGKTIEQERNDEWLKGVHPGDVEKCRNIYKIALEHQKGFYIEYRLLRHDGQYRWISDNSVPRFNPKGEFAGFISACVDIDDQKRFREKILDSELLFKTISNVSPVGLWMTDTSGMNTFVNDTWIKWTGMPLEKQLGTGWLDRVLEEDKVDAPQKFQEAMANRKKYTTEFRLLRADGELRWCLTEGSPFYDINGEFAGYAGSVTDITDIRKLEQRKDDFIKMASHELKTPITSIKGYVQLLLNIHDEMDEKKWQEARGMVRSSLGTVSKQVTKLTRLVSELLDLTRIDSGKLELYKTNFNPVVLVEESVQDIMQTATRHRITIENKFEGSIHADRDRISQVILNLLTNAVKYSPAASTVEVSITGDGRSLTFSVADCGIGIDKKEQGRIFERFYRVEGKNELTYPGFGIGLFIAAEIVQRHDGSITVESEKGKGSVFSFTLPL